MKTLLLKLLFTLFLLSPIFGYSHAPEQGYIFLRVYENGGVEGRFELLSDDLNKIFGWDLKSRDNDLESVLVHSEDIKAYLIKKSNFKSILGQHNLQFGEISIFHAGSIGDYVQIHFVLDNFDTIPDDLEVTYNIAFEESSTHRGFLTMEYNWKAGVINDEANIAMYFTRGKTTDTMSLTEGVSIWKGFMAMIQQGIWHIWIGLDHILFLVALVLPAVVRRRKKEEIVSITKSWDPVEKFKPAFMYILKIVTFFTLAHTITLSLAALQIIILPSWIVESIIAFSIGLAAYHNIKPIFKGKDWVIAFAFGLFHGFGFASVLGDIGLKDEFLAYSLLGFNLGVEIGQIAIIAAIFPVLYLIRKRSIYSKVILFGSILLIVISLYWVIERVFDINMGVEDYIKVLIYKLLVLIGIK